MQMYVWIVGRCVVPSRNSNSVCISMYWPVLRYYPEQCVWELGAYNLQHRGYRGTQVGVGNLDFCNIVGPNWELGIWEFIAKNDIVGGHLGKQKHCSYQFLVPLAYPWH